MVIDKYKLVDMIKEEFPFPSFQNGQLHIIFRILNEFINSKKKYFILEAPTGIGKSVIAYTVGRVLTRFRYETNKELETPFFSSTVLTKTRQLQVQYRETFKDIKSLWSAKNYECIANPQSKITYGDEICPKFKCHLFESCPYVVARNEFTESEIRVTNYAYFAESGTIQTDLLVFDEAHSIEKILCERFSVVADSQVISELTKFLLSYQSVFNNSLEIIENISTGFKQLFQYILNEDDTNSSFMKKLQLNLQDVYEFLDSVIEEPDDYSARVISKFQYFHSIVSRILQCLTLAIDEPQSYVKIFNKNVTGLEVSLKPLNTARLFKHITRNEKILFMSATICGVEEFAKDLNIKKDMYSHLSLDSPFPVANRLIHFKNLEGLNYRNIDSLMNQYVRELDKILSLHPNDHGIVHTVSYKIAEAILDYSEFSDRFIIPSKGQLFDFSVLDEIPGSILLSPAMTEGVDLKDDLSRFQVIFKIPAPNLGDKWVKAKFDLSKDWYTRETVITAVQSYGRSIRHAEDSASTYILDGSFSRLLTSKFLPKYFIGAVVK